MLTTSPTAAPAFMDILHDGKTKLGKAVREVDGFWYFLPGSNGNGLFEAHTLREIADLLDNLNAPYNEEIDKYFASLSPQISQEEQSDGMPF